MPSSVAYQTLAAIAQLVAQRELIFLAGPGPAVAAGYMPNGRDFAHLLSDKFGLSADVGDTGFATVATHVQAKSGRGPLMNTLAETLADYAENQQAFTSPIGSLFSILARYHLSPIVVSTAIDDFVERALLTSADQLDVLYWKPSSDTHGQYVHQTLASGSEMTSTPRTLAPEEAWERYNRDTPLVIKLMGRVSVDTSSEPHDAVLTDDDIIDWVRSDWFTNLPVVVRAGLVQNSILCLGFSGTDTVGRAVLRGTSSGRQGRRRYRSWCVLLEPSELHRDTLARAGFELLDADLNEFADSLSTEIIEASNRDELPNSPGNDQPLDKREDRPDNDTTVSQVASVSGEDTLSGTHSDLAHGAINLASAAPDTAGGEDVLGLQREVDSLAAMLSAVRTGTPLAVGLFGDWGTGKSFFMRLIQDRIDMDERMRAEDANAYRWRCTSVRQVKFNAWHYAEVDLWPSLMVEIFDQLAVHSAKSEQQLSEAERRSGRKQVGDLQRHLAELRAAAKAGDPNSVNDPRGSPVRQSVRRWMAWARYYREYAEGVGSSFVQLVVRSPVASSIAVLLCLLAVFGMVGLSTRIGVVTATLTAVASPVLVVLVSVWRHGVANRQTAQHVWSRLRRRPEDLQSEIRVNEMLLAARQRLLTEDSGSKLAFYATEQHHRGAYRSQLGAMTTIRNDLATMSEMLRHSKGGVDADAMPRVDRIILFVDDLDRCSPRRVVEVLEAIHLLLAADLFIVVVAVDPRWLLQALDVHYDSLFKTDRFNQQPSDGRNDREELWETSPSNYLEKIFQVPFTIRPLTRGGLADLVDALLEDVTASDGPSGAGPTAARPVAQATFADGQVASADGRSSSGSSEEHSLPDTGVRTVDSAKQHGSDVRSSLASNEILERERTTEAALADEAVAARVVVPEPPTPRELSYLQRAGPGAILTPRATKRMVNSYQLLRTLERGMLNEDQSQRTAVVLLGIVVGFPDEAEWFFRELLTGDSWSDWESLVDSIEGESGGAGSDRFRCWLRKVSGEFELGQIPAGDIRAMAPTVGRLSFRVGRVVAQNEAMASLGRVRRGGV